MSAAMDESKVMDQIFPYQGAERVTIACGATHPDPNTERRFRALREAEGHKVEGGCGSMLHWTYAFRCVECCRWFHRQCILDHFAESKHHALKEAP